MTDKAHECLFGKPLSSNEREALILVAEGESAKSIAHAFGKSMRTVEICMARLKAKLGARNIAHAVTLGFAKGVITLDDFKTE
jgi:DNA-binding CsgD family transcriptional regulator